MQRYFIKNNYRQNDVIITDDSMYKHITKVMRMERVNMSFVLMKTSMFTYVKSSIQSRVYYKLKKNFRKIMN